MGDRMHLPALVHLLIAGISEDIPKARSEELQAELTERQIVEAQMAADGWAAQYASAPDSRPRPGARFPRASAQERTGQETRHKARHRRPAPAGIFLGAAGQTICYHVHDGSHCDIGGVNELPSRQTGSVGRSGDHRPDCARRGVRLAERLAGRRDATSAVKHYSVLPGRLHPT